MGEKILNGGTGKDQKKKKTRIPKELQLAPWRMLRNGKDVAIRVLKPAYFVT
jgi:hypothetical protein